MSRVAILGCGYVGIELGRQLARDHEVIGVRRSAAGLAEIEAAGFEAVAADVTDADSLAAVPDVDWVVFAASSGGRGAAPAREIYVEGQRTAIESLFDRRATPDRYVYTSSTGVYGDHGGDWVDETVPVAPETPKAEVLAEAEAVALSAPREYGVDGTVARLAGIYGPDRYRIERYVSGPVTEGYRNAVHRDDAAGAIRFLLGTDVARGEVVLVVDDEPVDRWTLADWLAGECGEPAPPKLTVEERLEGDVSRAARRRLTTSKRCSNDKLRALGYEFQYPTFREGYRDAIEAYRDGRLGTD
ncbi:MAG: SDR family oxidoreductase [Salinirussus sp.]